MKKIFIAAVIAAFAGIGMVSCGGKRDADTARIVDEQSSQLQEAMQRQDMNTVSAIADSMALYVDDLTPDETVTVLLAFLEIHNRAVEAGNASTDLETLRKYVDVYDIATGNNPNDMREAFARARSVNGAVDFEKAAADFRRSLAEYDAVRTYGDEPQPEAADTTATVVTDSVAVEAEAVSGTDVDPGVRPID